MRKLLIIAILALCLSNKMSFADVSVGAPVGNAATTTTNWNPIEGIVNGVEAIDAWIQKNLW